MSHLRYRLRAVRAARDDRGMTLIELLIVMVMMPVILGALAVMLMTLLDNTVSGDPKGTAVRLADSHDAQISAAYFVRDVQGAAYVSDSTSPLCAPAGASGNQVLGLEWTSGSNTIDVSYYATSAPLQLVRYYCTTAGTPSSYPAVSSSTSVIADNLFSTLTSTSPVTCPSSSTSFGYGATTCLGNGSSAYVALTVSCFNGGCSGLSTLPGMAVHPSTSTGVGVATVQIQALESLSSYRYSLTASPRSSNPAKDFSSTNPGQSPPLIINGTVNGGNCYVSVTGAAAVDSTNNGSISDQPQGVITTTGGIYTADPNPSGSTTGSQGTVSPTPVYGTAVTSPYTALASPPSVPSGASYPQVTENASNWDPSTDTSVETNGVLSPTAYPNGALFIVNNGMTISKKFSAPQGALFYVKSGSVSISGNGTVSINPLNPDFESPTQPMPELVLWMDASDTGSLTLGGNGNTTDLNGAVYAPSATTNLHGGGNSGGLTVSALDTGNLSCNGQDSVAVVGPSPATTTTTVSPSSTSVSAGSTLTASALVTGSGSTSPTGSVSFYWCGPASASGCGQTSGWTNTSADQVGSAVTLTPGSNSTSTATSSSYTTTVAGNYCFAAYYTPSGSYSSSYDSSADGCFTVTANPLVVTITTPVSGACYGTSAGCTTWPGAFSGTATDVGGPGVASVTLTVLDTSSNKYFKPSTNSFSSSTPVSLPATLSGSTWTYSFSSGSFPSGNKSYTITAQATDTSSATASASASFSTK